MLPSKTPDRWGERAWQALVPLRLKGARPVLRLYPQERRSFSEAFIWPTGVGVSWNNWIEARITIEDLLEIAGAIRNREIDVFAADGNLSHRRLKGYYHDALEALRGECWGHLDEGHQSDLLTVISIVKAEVEDEVKDVDEALAALLSGLAKVWGERPKKLDGDRAADETGTVYASKSL